MKNVVAVLQARMSSTRLPGKVMKPILGRPMIAWQIERVCRASKIDHLVVATSTDSTDDLLASEMTRMGVDVVRGDLNDVLLRFMEVRRRFPAGHYLRLTGDCPLLDPEVIDRVIDLHLRSGFDYTSNAHEPSYPDGLDTEVITDAALVRSNEDSSVSSEREHVTLHVRNHPERYRLGLLKCPRDLSAERWTVDTPEDFALIQKIFEEFKNEPNFGMNDVIRLLDAHPEWRSINSASVRNEGLMKSLRKDELNRRYQRSMEWLTRAEKSIPLGSQTFSKSRTHYPYGVSPYFIRKGKGSTVWDLDGNEYTDFVSSLCAINLGHGDPDVNAAVTEQLEEGVIFSLPHPIETHVAEKIIEMVPCAEKVRFGKNGSDATAGAVRVARAFTKRDRVIVCGYHGWQDWYIGSTARNKGVPEGTRSLTHPVPYNDLAAVERALLQHKDEFAAVILEPMNVFYPNKDYLEGLKELARHHGALLIFDETITGFRYSNGGAQELFGVIPDLATFGKGIANGYPVSAVAGRADVMREMEDVFFSFTFGGETLSLAAALATMNKLTREPVIVTMTERGRAIQDGLRERIKKHGVGDFMGVEGHPTWSFATIKDHGNLTSWQIKTLFLQEMYARGILTVGSHNLSYAHSEGDVRKLLGVYDEVLPILNEAVIGGKIDTLLVCKPLQPLFKVR